MSSSSPTATPSDPAQHGAARRGLSGRAAHEIGEHETLLSIDKARRVLGYNPTQLAHRGGRRLALAGLVLTDTVEAPGDVQDGAPVPAEHAAGALAQAPPDLPVQPLPLPRRHRDVVGERVQQPEIAVGVVADLPVELARPPRRRTSRWPRCQPGGRAPRRAGRRRAGRLPRRSRRTRPGSRRRTCRRRPGRRGPDPRSPAGRQARSSPHACRYPAAGSIQCQAVAAKTRSKVPRRGGRQVSKSVVHDAGRPESAARLRRAAAASSAPGSRQVIASPRRASGSVAFPVAQPISSSRAPRRWSRAPDQLVVQRRPVVGPGLLVKAPRRS